MFIGHYRSKKICFLIQHLTYPYFYSFFFSYFLFLFVIIFRHVIFCVNEHFRTISIVIKLTFLIVYNYIFDNVPIVVIHKFKKNVFIVSSNKDLFTWFYLKNIRAFKILRLGTNAHSPTPFQSVPDKEGYGFLFRRTRVLPRPNNFWIIIMYLQLKKYMIPIKLWVMLNVNRIMLKEVIWN